MSYQTLFLTERGERHQRAALDAAPAELDVRVLRTPTTDELRARLSEAVFLISERSVPVDASMIAAAPNLKLILRLGSLTHDIDLEAARARNIVVCRQPVRGSIMVAEHAVMQMLTLSKRLLHVNRLAVGTGDYPAPRRTDEDTFAYNWTRTPGIEGLWRATVGILGFGEVGAELGRRLRGWDCTMLYHRRRRLPGTVEEELVVRYGEPEEVLAGSDFVVNLLPYSAETDGYLNSARLGQMKPGAYLVNCGSGSVVDEEAAADLLKAGRLGGIALDTYEWEPMPPANALRLLALDRPALNILLTPHTAAGSPPAGVRTSRAEDYEPILQYLRGEAVSGRIGQD